MTPQRWEVLTLCGGQYENVWESDGKPETFATFEEAEAALVEHLRDYQLAVEAGYMDDAPSRDEFEIQKSTR